MRVWRKKFDRKNTFCLLQQSHDAIYVTISSILNVRLSKASEKNQNCKKNISHSDIFVVFLILVIPSKYTNFLAA